MDKDIYFKLFQNICLLKNQAFLAYNNFLGHVSLILSPPPLQAKHGQHHNGI